MQQTQEERRATLGSSDAGAALGVCPWQSPADLWLKKTGQMPGPEMNEAMHFGNVLEEVIATEFSRRTGLNVRRRNQTFVDKEYPWMTAHPDRTIDGERTILECKSSSAFLSHHWGESGTDEVPQHYLVQVYHQMAVMGYDKAIIAALIGGNDFRTYPIKRDPELADSILKGEVEFWDYVVRGESPPPQSEADADSLWKFSSEQTVEADDVLYNALDNLKSLKERMDELGEEQEMYRMAIKDAMREKMAIVSADGTPLTTWKTHQQSYFQKKALAEKHPDLIDEFTEEKPVRKFLVKWNKL